MSHSYQLSGDVTTHRGEEIEDSFASFIPEDTQELEKSILTMYMTDKFKINEVERKKEVSCTITTKYVSK